MVLVLAWSAGCAVFPQHQSSPPPKPSPPPVTASSRLVILLTDRSPPYEGVAREIAHQWQGVIETITVSEEGSSQARSRAQASATTDVVAIGLPAARVARSLSGKKVVFCQVFNHEEQDIVRPWMKGVSAVTPVKQQFKAWKEFDPKLRAVAVIVGSGLKRLIAEAKAAARENGIKLRYIQVSSDLALRSAYRRLGSEVQGLWLVPDNRVLSHDALRDILTQSKTRGRRVLVMNEQLLEWGATMSAESDFGDIAQQVIRRIRAAAGRPHILGPALAPLTKTRINTKPPIASDPRASLSSP